MNIRTLIPAISSGVAITLLTGLISNTPPMLVGATWYGYPWAWLIRLVLAPEYFPWRVDALFLIIDIIFWAVIVGIVSFTLKTVKKKPA
jgi:hypothetical protein